MIKEDLEQEKFNKELEDKLKIDFPKCENRCDEVYNKCVESCKYSNKVKFIPWICSFTCLLIMCLVCGIMLVNNVRNRIDKVNITFVMDGKETVVEVAKGYSISSDIIPLTAKNEFVELYYDENMECEYDGSVLNEDSKMYVKNMGEEKLYNEVREAYLNEYIKPVRENSTIEDVCIFEYLGTYGDNYVAIILDRKNCVFYDIVYSFEIEDLKFTCSEGYNIYVYNNGELMGLGMSYARNLLSYENIVQIYRIYYGKK